MITPRLFNFSVNPLPLTKLMLFCNMAKRNWEKSDELSTFKHPCNAGQFGIPTARRGISFTEDKNLLIENWHPPSTK